jgi:hypothetical protein
MNSSISESEQTALECSKKRIKTRSKGKDLVKEGIIYIE